ncbi:diacylglycerol O-acyltransferase 1 [Irineochytrium annulatum]|nr:diacylglycerol O-acyltransferase 1 [Irineochytrium annulatum]
MAIRFAPASIPFPRRRQTAAVVFWMCLVPLCLVLFLLILITPRLTPWALAYLVFISLDPAAETGARKIMFLRRLPFWKWFADFFPITLVRTTKLDPSKNYVFGYHPHGIISLGAFTNFGTEATGFGLKFPGIDLRVLTLEVNFNAPIMREILLSLGFVSASRRSVDNILMKGPGNSAMIVVGGAAEALNAFPYTADLVLKKRLGFIKVALRHGASLVPVFSFGENDVWDQVDNQKGSTLRKIQMTFQKYASFSPPLFHGRGVFNYDVGMLPYRRAITSVVGAPIDCPKLANPSEADLLFYQKKYLDALEALYHEHKEKYAPIRKKELCFVE